MKHFKKITIANAVITVAIFLIISHHFDFVENYKISQIDSKNVIIA
jgi:hypothetical protein